MVHQMAPTIIAIHPRIIEMIINARPMLSNDGLLCREFQQAEPQAG